MPQTLFSSPSAAWEWLDLVNPSPAELELLAEKHGLHPASVKDALQPEHLPKYEFIDEILFIITRLHDPKAHLEADTIQELTNKIAIFYTDKFLITIHMHPVSILEEVKNRYSDNGLSTSPAEVLVKILKGCVKTFEGPALKLSDDLDYFESKIFLEKKIPPLNKGLYHLKRKAAVSRRVIQLDEIVLDSLVLPAFEQPAVQDLRDTYLHLENQYEEISDSAQNLINTYLSVASQKTNDVMRVLTIFSVFFMPLTFIAGIYGMNFEMMPELKARFGYPVVMAVMGLVTLCIYIWFRRKAWL